MLWPSAYMGSLSRSYNLFMSRPANSLAARPTWAPYRAAITRIRHIRKVKQAGLHRLLRPRLRVQLRPLLE